MDIVLQQRRQLQELESEYLTFKASIDCINKGTHWTALNPWPSLKSTTVDTKEEETISQLFKDIELENQWMHKVIEETGEARN